ncbi:hypothetical protein P0082_00140 [Candidatus Haliotispira prima]|uniref:Uncharacterized protein n=1 Tax=Candidatus Haliotispira prima TaxID=3034016 RepID=A0ABY8MIV5_9SPIO|nr:hypothetical protein P0082_00140 [Candidatus Haliotispira prima]
MVQYPISNIQYPISNIQFFDEWNIRQYYYFLSKKLFSLSLFSCFFISLFLLLFLGACSDPPGSSNPGPGTGDPHPEEQTFTPSISWRGIRAVELQINTKESVAVAFIVRAASEAAPSYADVETNIALQSRSVTSGIHYFYTAMHHGSNQNLSANITAATAGDYLTAGTAYKAYVFQDKKLVNTLDFSTLALPAAADWDGIKPFIDGTFPYRADTYQIDIQEGSVVLMPIYMKELFDVQGIQVVRPDGGIVVNCQLPSAGGACLGNASGGYTMRQNFEHTTVAADTYARFDFGIRQLAAVDAVSDGLWTFTESAAGRNRQVTLNVH